MSDQTQPGTAIHVPCEIGNDLLQSVFITHDHTVMVGGAVVFSSLFHRSREGPSGDLSAIQVKHQLRLLTFDKTHLVNGRVQIGLKFQHARISVESQRREE